jgi:hypothetical protein
VFIQLAGFIVVLVDVVVLPQRITRGQNIGLLALAHLWIQGLTQIFTSSCYLFYHCHSILNHLHQAVL